MTELTQIILGLIGFAGVALGAILTWLSKRSDKATQTLDMALKQLGERVAALEVKNQDLTERLDKSEREHEVKDLRIRHLEGENLTLSELLGDYRSNALNWIAFKAGGSVPPPPEHNWRIRADLEQIKKEVAG